MLVVYVLGEVAIGWKELRKRECFAGLREH